MSESPRIPVITPLAGLATYEEAARPSYSVDDNVERMRRYNRIKVKLFELSTAFINPTPEWEIKGALSLHLYLDTEHSLALRQRVAELRKPPHHLDTALDAGLEAFLSELFFAKDSVEFLTGMFKVIRPALLAAFQQHLAKTNPLFDFPTARLLRIAIPEEEQMISWGQEALAALLVAEPEKQAESDAWERHLNAYLAAAGGVNGDEPVEPVDLPEPRATRAFAPSVDPRRDARSGAIYNFHYRANDVYQDLAASPEERNLALMFKRFHEMDVPEMMASILLQTRDKPWEYYRDMARQLWDEARHSMMGEVWFAKHGIDWSKYPNHVGWSMHLNLDRTPVERHIILYYIEQNLMDGQTGKRWEWEIAQQARDPLTTYFQDYDWADEVLHAQIGRKWLKPELGSVRQLIEEGKRIAALPSPSLEARALTTPQEDWWPRFVRDVLGRESASLVGAENRLIPRFESVASG